LKRKVRLAAIVAVCIAAGVTMVNRASAQGLDAVMDEATARAMLARFGFGATPATLSATMALTPRQYIERAINAGSALPPSVVDTLRALPLAPADETWTRLGPGGSARERRPDPDQLKLLQQEERRYLNAAVQARLLAMANSDNPAHEALLAFWLNHFSIYAQKGPGKLLAGDYVQSIERAMRTDSFEALLRASFFSPAMQVYLDNTQSTAPDSTLARFAAERGRTLGINENLARELLELHTLGVDGGYTQSDVQELARIITGAGIYAPRMQERNLERAGATRMGLFLFDPRRHDYGEKIFLGQRFPAGEGMAEIDRALRLLALHPATARHVAYKLAQRFLSDDPPPALVEAMARGFLAGNGSISATLWPLLQSREFERSLRQPGKFKEPVDFVLSAARAACGDQPVANAALLAAALLDMGEAPLMHTTPDGYGARESDWLSSAAMAKRVRLAMGVAAGRVPLAADGVAAGQAMGDPGMNPAERRRRLLQGPACSIDAASTERLVGPVSNTTLAAAAALSQKERVALLLASPEFMRR